MGGSQSKTVVNQLSQQISNIATSIVQNCEVAANQSQNLIVNNSGFKFWGSYKLEQQSDINSQCFSDLNKQTQLQNQIEQTISQATTSQNVALLGAFGSSTSSARANLKNIIQNNITMNNIQNSYNSIRQSQNASFSNSGVVIIESVELIQGSKLFAAAVLKEIDKTGIFNSVSSYVDQQAKSSQENPLDFISKSISSVAEIVFLFIFVVIIIIVFIVSSLSAGSPDSATVQ